MRYDEREELEATGEWLLRINRAGFSEELTYVPSKLAELGVAPKDVVDRLEWLREHKIEEPVAETTEQETTQDSVSEEVEPEQDSLTSQDDSFGPWEWFGQIEKKAEEYMTSLFSLEPGLPDFNQTAAFARQRKRRGKTARAAVPTFDNQLASATQ